MEILLVAQHRSGSSDDNPVLAGDFCGPRAYSIHTQCLGDCYRDILERDFHYPVVLDGGQMVESGVRLEPEFTRYQILT